MYAVGRMRMYAEEMAYRTYVTDSLMLAPQGMYLSARFEDAIRPREEIDVEGTIDHILARMGE